MRVTRQEWISAGLSALESEGHQGLSAEKLARRLGVTRGSFYHHFDGTDAYVDALLSAWFEEHTVSMLGQAQRQDPREALAALIDLTCTMPIALENAIRAWSTVNARVGIEVAKVEQLRMATLTALYTAITGQTTKGATFAKIAYYGLIGAAHAIPRMNDEALRNVVTEVHDLMMSSL